MEINWKTARDNKLEAKVAFKKGADTNAISVVTLAGKLAAMVRFGAK